MASGHVSNRWQQERHYSNRLHRILGVTLKTTWFMSHRIRGAMCDTDMEMFGGEVQADETYIGNKPRVVSLLDKRTGKTRSIHTPDMIAGEVAQIARDNVKRESRLVTDEARHYRALGREFLSHESVTHAAEKPVTHSKDENNQVE